jgi:hypothetical protein
MWIDELPYALWGNRTSHSQATSETHFFIVYGAEAVLPPEVTVGSLHVKTYDKAMQDQLQHEDIDLVDEQRWQSAIKNAWYWQALRRYHERFVHSRELQVDDLVLRWVLSREGTNKLSPFWEGPFWVTQVCHPRCDCLSMEDGEALPNPWSIEHLRKFYA